MKEFYEREIRDRLDRDSEYREFLFPRCYLFTDKEITDLDSYPFYGNWNKQIVGAYKLYTQNKAHSFVVTHGELAAALVGHAFDPFTDTYSEEEILSDCIQAFRQSRGAFFEIVDRITGVFVILLTWEKNVIAVQDCAAMQMLYYGQTDGNVWMSSSAQLIGDICALKRTPYVQKLLNSKGYYRGSRYLPGNLSPYAELTRLGANLYVEYNGEFRQIRFFPVKERRQLTEDEKPEALEKIYALFRKNIEMILKKWDTVALSLSGGVDSKTTLACSKGLYDRLMCFSFASKSSEKLDADAAAEICKALGIPHTYYVIPEDSAQIRDYDFLSKLIDHNTAYLSAFYDNEIRKYIWLSRKHDYQVEMKSDSSEIGRAIMERKYLVPIPKILAPRHLTAFHARYFFEPGLMHAADKANKTFMEETGLTGPICGYEHLTLFFWEVRLGSWYATAFQSHQFFGEVIIPYNNRKLMELFYTFSYEDRLNDVPHLMLMRRGNAAVADLNVNVQDTYFDKKRVLMETLYYLYATRLNTCGHMYLPKKDTEGIEF